MFFVHYAHSSYLVELHIVFLPLDIAQLDLNPCLYSLFKLAFSFNSHFFECCLNSFIFFHHFYFLLEHVFFVWPVGKIRLHGKSVCTFGLYPDIEALLRVRKLADLINLGSIFLLDLNDFWITFFLHVTIFWVWVHLAETAVNGHGCLVKGMCISKLDL